MRNSTLLLFLIGSFALSIAHYLEAKSQNDWVNAKAKLMECKSPTAIGNSVLSCKSKAPLDVLTGDTEPSVACPKECEKKTNWKWSGKWSTNHSNSKKPEDKCECIPK